MTGRLDHWNCSALPPRQDGEHLKGFLVIEGQNLLTVMLEEPAYPVILAVHKQVLTLSFAHAVISILARLDRHTVISMSKTNNRFSQGCPHYGQCRYLVQCYGHENFP